MTCDAPVPVPTIRVTRNPGSSAAPAVLVASWLSAELGGDLACTALAEDDLLFRVRDESAVPRLARVLAGARFAGWLLVAG